MKSVIQSKQSERGQEPVELALTITLFNTLLAGTVDLGRVSSPGWLYAMPLRMALLMARYTPLVSIYPSKGLG